MEKIIFVYKLAHKGVEIDSRELHLAYCIEMNKKHKYCYQREVEFLQGTESSNEEFAIIECFVS